MAPSSSVKTVLMVGASRGLGLGLALEYLRRGWRVIATVRKIESAPALRGANGDEQARLEIEVLDINLPDQLAALRQRLAGRRLDLLFVNAGVMSPPQEKIGNVTTEEFTRVLVTNALSPLRMVESFASLVPAGGTIAVMSSGMGSAANNEKGEAEVYRASKVALNSLMRSFAARETAVPRVLLAMDPGWVRTDMGGQRAPLDVATSVRGMADVIDARAGRTGMAFINYKGDTVNW
jgi:NAD(P)-dependent dehydrogenase (short-subunit alcohol dehydrogenase family)